MLVEATVKYVLAPCTVKLPVIVKSLVTVMLLLNNEPTIDPGIILLLAQIDESVIWLFLILVKTDIYG